MNKSLIKKAKKLNREAFIKRHRETIVSTLSILGLGITLYLVWPAKNPLFPPEITSNEYKQLIIDIKNQPECLKAKKELLLALRNTKIDEPEKRDIYFELEVCKNPTAKQQEEMDIRNALKELAKYTMPGPFTFN